VRLIHVIRINPRGEHLNDVLHLPTGEVFDLLAAIALSVALTAAKAADLVRDVAARSVAGPS
jgi:hypothetical protein